jgi:hypothetical protein
VKHSRLSAFLITAVGAFALILPQTGQAQATTSPIQQKVVTGCGAPLTVYVPRSSNVPASSFTAAGLSVPASSPVLQRALKRHVRWLPTVTCQARPNRPGKQPGPSHHLLAGTRPSSGACTSACSPNWSGYVAPNVPNVSGAQAEWTVPNVNTIVDGGGFISTYSSIWPGIGTGNGDELIQAGTEQDQICLSGQCGYSYYFWLEMYPAESEQQITNLTPAPGDDVSSAIGYNWGTGQAAFILCDFTKNLCVNGTQQSPQAPALTAEWIAERPSLNGQYTPLADYTGVWIWNSLAFTNANTQESTPADNGAYALNMTDCANTIPLASVGPLDSSGGAFADDWNNFGTAEGPC